MEARRRSLSGGTGGSFTQTFGYDDYNRLNTFSDNGGSGISQTLDHDRYGNMWQSAQMGLGTVPALTGVPFSQASYDATTNRFTPGSYEAGGSGNQNYYQGVQMIYDAENRILQSYNTVSGNTYTYLYDGLGQRVAKVLGGGAQNGRNDCCSPESQHLPPDC